MTYFKPEIIPGMRKDGSQYEAMNTWFDGNNVRFKLGKPQSIGGWAERTLKDFADAQRDLLTTVSLFRGLPLRTQPLWV